jgi:hypothetical protein
VDELLVADLDQYPVSASPSSWLWAPIS